MDSYSYTESYSPSMSMTSIMAPVMAELVRQRCGLKTDTEKMFDFVSSLGRPVEDKKPSMAELTELAEKLVKSDSSLSMSDAIMQAADLYEVVK